MLGLSGLYKLLRHLHSDSNTLDYSLYNISYLSTTNRTHGVLLRQYTQNSIALQLNTAIAHQRTQQQQTLQHFNHQTPATNPAHRASDESNLQRNHVVLKIDSA